MHLSMDRKRYIDRIDKVDLGVWSLAQPFEKCMA